MSLSSCFYKVVHPAVEAIGSIGSVAVRAFSWATGEQRLKARGIEERSRSAGTMTLLTVASSVTIAGAIITAAETGQSPLFACTATLISGFVPAHLHSLYLAGKHDSEQEKQGHPGAPPSPAK